MKRFLIWLLAGALLLCGCRKNPQTDVLVSPEVLPTEDALSTSTPSSVPLPVSSDGQLYCMANSLEEAEDIAELYEIHLVNYSEGIAVYYTDEDPREIISQGQKNNWPALSLNETAKLY